MASSKGIVALVKEAASDFADDECPRMAAALSYYTVFSLPPLLVLILLVASIFLDPQDVQGALAAQIQSLMGPDAAGQIRTILEQAERPGASKGIAAVLGIVGVLFGATGVFIELQGALNRAWEVAPDPEKGGLKNMITKRVFSLGMILTIAFVLLVSLALSAVLSSFGDALAGMIPGLGEVVLHVINFVISFGVITLLFAAMFKVIPDAEIAWRDVWVGAAATAFLFVVGKFLIGFYLGRSDPGQAYGAAGSLAVLLVWIYYSAMILFFGAEFTQKWAENRGGGIRPEKGAVRVVKETHHIREPEAGGSKQSASKE